MDLTLNYDYFSPSSVGSSSVVCGPEASQIIPIFGSTTEGNFFEFNVTFTSSSVDGNSSNGFSLALYCE